MAFGQVSPFATCLRLPRVVSEMLISASAVRKRLVAGEQHVVAGGEAAENVVLDHIVGFVFKEQIAFVLINIQPQRANFLVLQGVDGRLGSRSARRGWC
ncbi:hypothetical protein LNP17_13905 [Klebsiella variicola subsp. variicola]|nr:hypothetical protein [Klebsiella variicola subsp. variicola]